MTTIGTKAAYARHRGVTDAAISHHLRSGRLRPALTPDQRLNFDLADAILGASLDPGQGGDRRSPAAGQDDQPGAAALSPLAADRARLVRAQAERAELELQRARGEVVAVEEVRRGAREIAVGLVASLEQHRLDLVRAVRGAATEPLALAAAEAVERKIRSALAAALVRVVHADGDAEAALLERTAAAAEGELDHAE